MAIFIVLTMRNKKVIQSVFALSIFFTATSLLSSYVSLRKPTRITILTPKLKSHLKPALACPTIITDDVFIQSSSCTASTGAILKIHGTGLGVHSYTWYDANGKIVGSDSSLVNIPGGQYTVSMRDEGKCSPAIAGPFTVPVNTGITINESGAIVTPTNCNNSDGSVSITSIAGFASFKWVSLSDTSKALSTTTSLLNVPIGYYEIRAFNQAGCETDSKVYHVNSKTIVPSIKTDTVVQATCNKMNGAITVRLLVAQNQPATNWYILDSNNQYVAMGHIQYTGNDVIASTCPNCGVDIPASAGLKDGTYSIAIGDPSTCLITLKTYTLSHAVFTLDTTGIVVYNDKCDKHIGAIGVADVIGGTYNPPFTHPIHQIYTWRDASGKVVSYAKVASLLSAGSYQLEVKDDGGCVVDSRVYTVKDSSVYIEPPVAKGNNLCLPGIATVTVENVLPATLYNFYYVNDVGDTTFIEQNSLGKIYKFVKKTTDFFVTRSEGTCESSKTKVEVVVAAPGVVIPNTFTPNQDGINDTWNITGLENYPGTQISIYARDGKLVYSSVGYGKPFNGTENGQPLPYGTYYYTIDLKKKGCGPNGGCLTIIR
jgi:gliding motility-associated-like protein